MSKKYDLDLESQVKNNPAFCSMPFVHQYIATDGLVNLCCIADYDNPILNKVQGHDLQKIWKK